VFRLQFLRLKTSHQSPISFPLRSPTSLHQTTTMEAPDTGVKPAAHTDGMQMSDRDSLSEKGAQNAVGEGELKQVVTEDIEYPSAPKAAVIMGCLFISMFLVALDRTIIATASRSNAFLQSKD
jgi:hypothetical protein